MKLGLGQRQAGISARLEVLVVGGIVTAAAVLRVVYLVVYARQIPYFRFPLGDAGIYLAWAQNILAGHVVGPGVFYRAPLYAYILAGIIGPARGNLLFVYLVQMVLGLGTLVLVYLTARRLAGQQAAVASLVLAAFSPVLPFFETKLLSASWVVFLVTLASFLLVLASRGGVRGRTLEIQKRPREPMGGGSTWLWAGAGLAYGTAVLAWPGAGFVLLATVVLAALYRIGMWRRVLTMVACAAVAVLPATLHNIAVGRDFVLVSANAGFTFYQGNNRLAVGTLAQPPEVYEFQKDGRYLTGISDQETFEQEYTRARSGQRLRASQISQFWFGRAFAWIARDLFGYAKLMVRKLGLALADYESPLNYNLDVETVLVWPLRLMPMHFSILLALALVAVLFGRRREYWAMLAVVAGTFAGLLVFYVSSRYRVLAVPVLAVLGGSGITILWQTVVERPRRFTPVALALAVLVVSRFVLVAPLRRGSMLLAANGFRNLGEAFHYRALDREKAEQLYRRAIEIQEAYLDPRSLQERVALEETRQLLASLSESGVEGTDKLREASEVLAAGDTTTALALLRDAIAADSGARQAYLVLGAVFGSQDRHTEARDVFLLAAGRFPQDPVVLYNLALASLKAGDRKAAIEAAEMVLRIVPGHPWAQEVIARAREQPGAERR
ncbi:MAG: glycosyltransferase family 39 protein [candidate division WOR-3 bacterium]